MNRKKTLGKLKIACVITALLGVALFFVVAPQILPAVMYTGQGGVNPVMYWIDMGYIWIVGALCFTSLWEAWKICREISRDNSFSRPNVVSLQRISRYMLIACAMMAAGLLVLLLTGAVGAALLGLVSLGVCISLILSLFARAMAELLLMASELKDENDLTI